MPAAHPADKMAHVSDGDVAQVMSITALGEEHRDIIMNALRGRDPAVVINEYYNDADKVCPPIESPPYPVGGQRGFG